MTVQIQVVCKYSKATSLEVYTNGFQLWLQGYASQ